MDIMQHDKGRRRHQRHHRGHRHIRLCQVTAISERVFKQQQEPEMKITLN